ncbi:hypothetical protein WN943_017873 [Citrus x changshan-huyou]
MDRWSGILRIPLNPNTNTFYRIGASLCLSSSSKTKTKALAVPSANAIFFNGDRVEGTGNPVIEKLSDLQNIADILVSKFGASVNAWVIDACVHNGPFAIYNDFVPNLNSRGEPKSYSPIGFPASTATVSLLSNCLQEAKNVTSRNPRESYSTGTSASSFYKPKTFILGFSKGGTVLNQLVTELGHLEANKSPVNAASIEEWAMSSIQEEPQIIPRTKESLLNSINEIHYVDVGLNTAGAYITDSNVIQRISKRLMEQTSGSGIRFVLHGTPRQWSDSWRVWIRNEKDKLVHLLESESQKNGGKLQPALYTLLTARRCTNKYFWESKILKYLGCMCNPLSWVMEAAAIMVIALAHGGGKDPDYHDFIGIVIIINSTTSFKEENNAGNAAAALMAQSYLRDGRWNEEDAAEMVPGDIISIKLGEIVSADARLVEGDPLKIDRFQFYLWSALTGESLPVTKNPGDGVYSGSTCKQGEIAAVVIANWWDSNSNANCSLCNYGHWFTLLVSACVDKDMVVLMAARASTLENQVAIDGAIVSMLAGPKKARVHFLLFNPTDKRAAITYVDGAGIMHRVSKGAPEQILHLAHKEIEKKEALAGTKDNPGGPWEFVGLLPLFDPPHHDSAETISDQIAIAKETGRKLGMGTNMYLSSSLLRESKDETNSALPIDELIEKADGFAGLFPDMLLDSLKFPVRFALSGRAWGLVVDQRDFGKEAREAAWAAEKRTLHGLQLQSTDKKLFGERSTSSHRDVNLMAEEAKRRAEIARMRELHTLSKARLNHLPR